MSVTVPARPERGNADPSTPPTDNPVLPTPAADAPTPPAAEADRAEKLHVYSVSHCDNHVRPYLVVSTGKLCPTTDTGNLFGHNIDHPRIGAVPAPANDWPLNLDAERAAWEAFGDHQGYAGRPTHVECVDSAENERVVADVAAAVWEWDRFVPPGHAGPPTPEAVAAAVHRHPADVRAVFSRFKLAETLRAARDTGPLPADPRQVTAADVDAGVEACLKLGLMARNADGTFDFTPAGRAAQAMVRARTFFARVDRVALALARWPLVGPGAA